jgi:hypothetical protein
MAVAVSLIDQARQAFARGEREKAFQLTRHALLQDSKSAPTWILMSRLVEDATQRRECLDRALAIDPECREARDAIDAMRVQELVSGFRAPVFADQKREPLRLGQALVAAGLISEQQLLDALREQHNDRNRGKKTMLGTILLRRKVVSPLALAAVLIEQQQSRSTPDRLGEYLLSHGMISAERLQHAIAEQALSAIYEKPIRLGELLVQRGYILQEDLDRALEEQRQDAYNKYYY